MLGGLAITAYLLICGRRGIKAAQVVAPSAAAFALVADRGRRGGHWRLGRGPDRPGVTGGFAAAGAILLALAVIASEEIAVLPFLHGSGAAKLLEASVPADGGVALDPATPSPIWRWPPSAPRIRVSSTSISAVSFDLVAGCGATAGPRTA